MVATCSVAPRTGNVSAGTSIFAMVVLERPLERVHHELDVVTTPAGDPVAMVHCNNGASELAAWVGLFGAVRRGRGVSRRHGCRLRGAVPRGARRASRMPGACWRTTTSRGSRSPGSSEGRPLFVRDPGQPLHPRELHARAALRRLRHAEPRDAGARGRGRRARPDVRARRHLPHRGRRPAIPGRRARGSGRRSARPRQRAARGASPCSRRTSRQHPIWISAHTCASGSSAEPGSTPSARTPKTSPASPPTSTRYRAGLAIEQAAVAAL